MITRAQQRLAEWIGNHKPQIRAGIIGHRFDPRRRTAEHTFTR